MGVSWLLVVNGLALGAYGLIPLVWTGPLSLRPFFALLLVAMAVSIGILAWTSGGTLRGYVPDSWFLGLAGVASVGYALAFLALDFRWINLKQPGSFFLLLGSYFGFSAICMLGLGLRLNRRRFAHQMSPDAQASPCLR